MRNLLGLEWLCAVEYLEWSLIMWKLMPWSLLQICWIIRYPRWRAGIFLMIKRALLCKTDQIKSQKDKKFLILMAQSVIQGFYWIMVSSSHKIHSMKWYHIVFIQVIKVKRMRNTKTNVPSVKLTTLINSD